MFFDFSDLISKILILYLCMLAGIYARKRNYINKDSLKSISSLVANVTNPLLIISSFQIDFSKDILASGAGIILASFLIHVFSAAISYLIFRKTEKQKTRSVYECATIFSNCAFMGYPLLMVLFGNEGLVYGVFYTSFFNIFFWSYGLCVLSRHKGKAKISAKKVLLNAGTVPTIIGIIMFIFSIKLPYIVYESSVMVGNTTFPLAMIIIGGLICDLDFKTAFREIELYLSCFVKLLIIPICTIFACKLLHASPVVTYTSIIMASTPSATFVAIFAGLYDVDSTAAAKAVGFSHIISMATIPLMMMLANAVI